jgi:hypothetical protein
VTGTPVGINQAVGGVTAASTASCGTGLKMLGGGVNVTSTGNGAKAAVASSYPSAANTWTATAIVIAAGSNSSSTITSYVICGA